MQHGYFKVEPACCARRKALTRFLLSQGLYKIGQCRFMAFYFLNALCFLWISVHIQRLNAIMLHESFTDENRAD